MSIPDFRHSLCAVVSFLALALQARAIEPQEPQMLSIDQFAQLEWGMTPDQFMDAYAGDVTVTPVEPDYYQDLEFSLFEQEAICGFRFGELGLEPIAVSFSFVQKDRRLDAFAVLAASDTILNGLTLAHGPPDLAIPWDGSLFSYFWVRNQTLIQFAWNGESNWGVHFASVELDPEAKAMADGIREVPD